MTQMIKNKREETVVEICLTTNFSTVEVALLHKRAVAEWLEENLPKHLWPDSFEVRIESQAVYDVRKTHGEASSP